MPSTVIRRWEYHADRQELDIIFTTGRRYIYSEVPRQAVDELRSAFAKGTHFNRHIRDRYSYREVDPAFGHPL